MRWPTIVEQGIGVLLLVFLATACMSALFIGLGSNWVINVLLHTRAIWSRTFQAALREAAKEKQTRIDRDDEIDGALTHIRTLEAEKSDLQRSLALQEHRTTIEREQRERDRLEYERIIAGLRVERDAHGKRVIELERERRQERTEQ